MTTSALATKPRGNETLAAPAQPTGSASVTVPAQTIARLGRLATANLLATGLAHELANPLTGVVAGLDALASRIAHARSQQRVTAADLDGFAADLELASVSTSEMFSLVRDFQLFLRPEAIDAAPVIDLKPSITRALRMARSRFAGTAPVTVELADAPAVRMPSSWVTQIVLNLLLNAADALAGRPWSANLVEVRLETVDHWAVIEVKDNGPGLDAAMRARLFEPGVSTKENATSLGLGLAISRELARTAGGDVTVSSPASAGTLFRVVLPPAGSPVPSAV